RPCSWGVEETDAVALLDVARPEHARVQAAPAGMRLLRDPRVVAAAEARLDVEAGAGGARHLDHDLNAQLQAPTGDHARPGRAHHGHVLANGARGDGMSIALERLDVLEGEQADRALGPAVVSAVALRVAGEPELGHGGQGHGSLGHATLGRYVDVR